MTLGQPSSQVTTQTPGLTVRLLPLTCPRISDSEQTGRPPSVPRPFHPPQPAEDARAPGQEEAERPRTDLQGGGLQLCGDRPGRLHVLCHKLRVRMPRGEPASELPAPWPYSASPPPSRPATGPACPPVFRCLSSASRDRSLGAKPPSFPHHEPPAELGAGPRCSQLGHSTWGLQCCPTWGPQALL